MRTQEREGRVAGRPRARMLPYVVAQVVLILLYFLPGGLVWNRVDPVLFGMPFGVVVTAMVLPGLIVLNMIWYVVEHWAEDRLVSSDVRVDVSARGAPRETAAHETSHSTPPGLSS